MAGGQHGRQTRVGSSAGSPRESAACVARARSLERALAADDKEARLIVLVSEVTLP